MYCPGIDKAAEDGPSEIRWVERQIMVYRELDMLKYGQMEIYRER